MSKITEKELRRRVIEYISGVQTSSVGHMEATGGLIELIQAYTAQQVLEARLADMKSLKDWIDRIHYQPVVEGDRWVQAAGEIIDKIDDRIAQLKQMKDNDIEAS